MARGVDGPGAPPTGLGEQGRGRRLIWLPYYSENKIFPYFVTLSEAKGLDSSAPAGPQNDR